MNYFLQHKIKDFFLVIKVFLLINRDNLQKDFLIRLYLLLSYQIFIPHLTFIKCHQLAGWPIFFLLNIFDALPSCWQLVSTPPCLLESCSINHRISSGNWHGVEAQYICQNSKLLVPALPNRFKQVFDSFEQTNIHCTLDFHPNQPGRNQMYQS